jgi:hypothetical protein
MVTKDFLEIFILQYYKSLNEQSIGIVVYFSAGLHKKGTRTGFGAYKNSRGGSGEV